MNEREWSHGVDDPGRLQQVGCLGGFVQLELCEPCDVKQLALLENRKCTSKSAGVRGEPLDPKRLCRTD